jgi:hypothetical protein
MRAAIRLFIQNFGRALQFFGNKRAMSNPKFWRLNSLGDGTAGARRESPPISPKLVAELLRYFSPHQARPICKRREFAHVHPGLTVGNRYEITHIFAHAGRYTFVQ